MDNSVKTTHELLDNMDLSSFSDAEVERLHIQAERAETVASFTAAIANLITGLFSSIFKSKKDTEDSLHHA